MEVGQGPNWGCSAIEEEQEEKEEERKKYIKPLIR
jgi:hypothetical protein